MTPSIEPPMFRGGEHRLRRADTSGLVQDNDMKPVLRRCRPVLCVGVLASAGALLLSGCSGSDAAGAVWTLDQQVGPDTTSFTAMVKRSGCNNGITGEVQTPDVEVEEDEVVVTFTVKPDQTEATCPDNDEVRYKVVLPEPIGDRRLVDGQCESGTTTSRTTLCEPDGVRYRPE